MEPIVMFGTIAKALSKAPPIVDVLRLNSDSPRSCVTPGSRVMEDDPESRMRSTPRLPIVARTTMPLVVNVAGTVIGALPETLKRNWFGGMTMGAGFVSRANEVIQVSVSLLG